tara:strand:+ start:789 stop:1133 length:345 start_codon:yes stop_codon:yes gene_type:complete
MNKPNDKELYEKAKMIADKTYKKPSAYKSGFIVKTYKELGGTYSGVKKNIGLKRWFAEKWVNIAEPNQYPVLRPSVKITKDTPLTINEIDPIFAKKQIALKQKIKGNKNLPIFI